MNFYLTDKSTETFSVFSLTKQIVFFKYKKQQNMTPATHSKKVGRGKTRLKRLLLGSGWSGAMCHGFCLCCLFTCSDGVYYFQSSESCGCVSMLRTVLCRVVTLRGFSGFSWGFRLRLPSRLVWLFPALCRIYILINSLPLCKASDILSYTNTMYIILTEPLTYTLDRRVCLYHVFTNKLNYSVS